MISCLSGRPCLFPGLPQLCCTSSLRVSSWQSIPDLSLGCNPTPQAWAWAPSPHSSWTWKPFLGWKVLFDNDLSGEFSPFCLPSTCCCVPLWGFVVPPPDPACEGGSECVETCPPSRPPPQGESVHCKILCLFSFSLSFALTHSEVISFSFWKSGIFCQCSEGVS